MRQLGANWWVDTTAYNLVFIGAMLFDAILKHVSINLQYAELCVDIIIYIHSFLDFKLFFKN